MRIMACSAGPMLFCIISEHTYKEAFKGGINFKSTTKKNQNVHEIMGGF